MTPETPQFTTAEYAGQQAIAGAPQLCGVCGAPLGDAPLLNPGQTVCASCASMRPAGAATEPQAAFAGALLLGAIAALLGLVAYAAFTIVTGFYIGYVALGVGYMVGKAIRYGSGGVGGRSYQIAAVLLTYASIALAAIPIAIWPRDGGHIAWEHLAPAAGKLLILGLASPLLELRSPVHGLLGGVILFIGLRIAWRLTAATPFRPRSFATPHLG